MTLNSVFAGVLTVLALVYVIVLCLQKSTVGWSKALVALAVLGALESGSKAYSMQQTNLYGSEGVLEKLPFYLFIWKIMAALLLWVEILGGEGYLYHRPDISLKELIAKGCCLWFYGMFACL